MPIKFTGPVKPRKLKSPDPINMPVVRDNKVPRVKQDVEYFKANGEMPSVYDGPYIAQTQNLIKNNKFAWEGNPDQTSTTADTADDWTNTSSSLYRIHTYTGSDNEQLGLTNGEELRYARGSNTAYALTEQTIYLDDLGINTALIDAGAVSVSMVALFGRDYADSDSARYRIIIISGNNSQLGTYSIGYINTTQWSRRELLDQPLPVGSRRIRVMLEFDRNAGSGSNGNILAPYLELNVVNNGANLTAFQQNGYRLV